MRPKYGCFVSFMASDRALASATVMSISLPLSLISLFFSGHLSRLCRGGACGHDVQWWFLRSFVDRTPQAYPSVFGFESWRNRILTNAHRTQAVKELIVHVYPFDREQLILSLESKGVIRPACTRCKINNPLRDHHSILKLCLINQHSRIVRHQAKRDGMFFAQYTLTIFDQCQINL